MSVDFYERNAEEFARATASVDMSELRRRFLSRLPSSAAILDAGCGSGRDAAAFLELGHRVCAIDASPKMARLAEAHIGQSVEVCRLEDVEADAEYDGVWACASLLHVPKQDLPDTLARLWRALRAGGVLYASFKYGEHERTKDGRHFTDATEARLAEWAARLPSVAEFECWLTNDARPTHEQTWLNALLVREVAK